MTDKKQITQAIKAEALRLGFYACGIAPALRVGSDEDRFSQWLGKGYQAGMSYLERNQDKRYDPCLLVEGTRSVISVALNYYPQRKLQAGQLQFAYYAYGKDYHDVMKEKLSHLFDFINREVSPVSGRVFCDTAPVLERFWAQQAGLGWIGKNTQLIIPGAGSYFFLGELFLDIELEYDSPVADRCGSCTLCLDNCPSKALEQAHLLNANKCLSYLTIENKENIPHEQAKVLGNRLYGCDQCQFVCPWNRLAASTCIPDFQPSEAFLSMQAEDWDKLSPEQYRILFKGSAVKRVKYEGLMRNLKAITGNKKMQTD